MAIVMARIMREIRRQSRRPIKEQELRDDDDDATELATGANGAQAADSLARHFDALDLYVPPLTTELLQGAFKDTAWAARASERDVHHAGADAPPCTSSTRSGLSAGAAIASAAIASAAIGSAHAVADPGGAVALAAVNLARAGATVGSAHYRATRTV